jgi:hypothetical protein
MAGNVPRMVLCILVLCFFAVFLPNVFCFAQTTEVPGCTNGDCSGPPSCSNGDCSPPGCTNGDCEPGDPSDCCCVGSNLPGTTRVCCCPTADLDALQCRLSQVLDTDDPEFHVTLAQETLDGFRTRNCDALLQRFCNPPVEEVCTKKKGQKTCEKVVKRVCSALDQACQYRFCGPGWFPFDEPTPNKDGCGWWDQIRECHR